jgi:hypothetical protein
MAAVIRRDPPGSSRYRGCRGSGGYVDGARTRGEIGVPLLYMTPPATNITQAVAVEVSQAYVTVLQAQRRVLR